MFGNQLNYMQSCWGAGYVLGGLPSNMILTRVRPSLFLPCVEVSLAWHCRLPLLHPSCCPAVQIIWGVLTLCLTACKTAQQMYAVRFFVGQLLLPSPGCDRAY